MSIIHEIGRWYQISAAAAGEADILLYDDIGDGGTTADAFVRDLRGIKAKTINLHINSPGGEVSAGTAIYNALRVHPAYVIVTIDGMAASAASVVAMAGDEIRIASNALMMVHEASGLTMGGADDHEKTAEILEKMNDAMAQIYASRTGQGTKAQWREAMRAETWYTASEAVTAGLADVAVDYSEGVKAAARFDLSAFKRVPAVLLAERRRELLAYTPAGQAILRKEAAQQPKPKRTERIRELLSQTPAGQAILRREKTK